MAGERLFAAEELDALGQRSVDLIQRAIDQGDYEQAKGLSRRMYKEFLAMHDLFRDWVTALLSFVGRRYGDEALREALAAGCAIWLKPLVEAYASAGPRRRAEMLAAGLRGHLQPLRLEEDDEKITIYMEPCGSGGRLVLEGSYEPPRNLLKVAQAQAMTYGRAEFPVYCAHCSFQESLPIEWQGTPLFITEPAAKLGEEPCRVHLYKRAEDIPARFYERLGKTKHGICKE